MRFLRFDTERLVCRPLDIGDNILFHSAINFDDEIQRFFDFGNIRKFLESLMSYECFPVLAFLRNNSNLVGYINGFVYSASELLVEYFIVEKYRRNRYARELLSTYLYECSKLGFSTFRFTVQTNNIPSIALLKNLGATHCVSEDFTCETSDSGRKSFFTYELAL